LPSADTACAGNYCTNSQMGEVYYNEEGGLAGRGYFSNVQAYGYWSSNQNASDSGSAWDFFTQHGLQYYDAKSFDFYALAVSGQVTTAPVPGAVWLFGTGLLGLPGLMKRRNRR